jgi:hypothetical protein
MTGNRPSHKMNSRCGTEISVWRKSMDHTTL